MTREEHFFMLLLFTRQIAKFNFLLQALKASGSIQADDVEAYRSYTLQETPGQVQEWLKETWESYQKTAANLGITTGLEHGPSLPE